MADRLERRFGARIEWRPYLLHPEYPPDGIPRAELRRKYGEDFEDRLRERFALEGLAFDTPPETVPNTRTALRLTELARAQGKHDAFHDRLMVAYWEQATDIGDREVLRGLAAEFQLEGVDEVLDTDLYGPEIEAETARAHSMGITGIPAYVLDNKLLVMGAQPDEVFARAFAQVETMS